MTPRRTGTPRGLWIVPAGCLGLFVGLFGLLGLLIHVVTKPFRGKGPRDLAVDLARKNRELVEALGEPILRGFLVAGSIRVSGRSGTARLAIPIRGPRGRARLDVAAIKQDGKWIFEHAEATLAGGRRIDLLGSRGRLRRLDLEPDGEAIEATPIDPTVEDDGDDRDR